MFPYNISIYSICFGLHYIVAIIGQYVWGLLCKYWIMICCSMMLIISLQEVVVYRIIYMIFFLLFMLTFQVNMTLTIYESDLDNILV